MTTKAMGSIGFLVVLMSTAVVFQEPSASTPEWAFAAGKRWVIRQYWYDTASRFSVGYLSKEGDFLPEPKILPVTWASIRGTKDEKLPIYNASEKPLAVFEYRWGKLVPGTLQAGFVPEKGGEVISMERYLKEYDPKTSRPIYNLPGEIVRKADSKGGK